MPQLTKFVFYSNKSSSTTMLETVEFMCQNYKDVKVLCVIYLFY